MDRLGVALITISFLGQLVGAVSSGQDGISELEVELIVRPGDNVTLYCDCMTSTGVDILWYRNCSHKHQPPLVISSYRDHLIPFDQYFLNFIPRFTLLWNLSNNTYDLLIENITESDLGLYYCGTMETKVNIGKSIEKQRFYNYGNVTTRLSFDISPTKPSSPPEDCGVCWTLMFSLCPVSALLSSLLSSSCVYSFCRKRNATMETAEVPLNRINTTGSGSREKEEQDLCYASLDIRQGQKRPKKKKVQNSDFSTYSTIKYQQSVT
ncbi:uncharacterized protein LOC106024221 [Esox lucius]|uniref:uncharacterized protein LOC106024221 n=1 Tax=Esox lucius TaxID=8010 RepID=UPI0010BE0EA5|nr:uncharacterized protein LOC106024221 [Esox lucius]XP_028974243.1 uncharacterized protein LOC106024221 [Esox lucius]